MWGLWPPVPLVDEVHHVVHVDGIHLHRDAVVLIAVAGGHVIGWHVAKSEKAAAWQCLMARIAPPDVLVCDGGGGVLKAAKATWPVYGQINVYGVTTKSERHKRSYWTRTADGNGIGGRKAPVPYGS